MRPSPQRRSGTILVWFALILSALMGIAALVIDLGLARNTQQQLQTATQVASLEGLRWRDELPPDAATSDLETERRVQARNTVVWLFQDTDGRQYGAGPVIQLSAGTTNLNALQTIESVTPFKPGPGMQLNPDDAPHGDMTAGRFETNPDYDANAPRDENAQYERRDFLPESDGDAFLVRLRRTNDFQNLDNIDEVSSSGPTLPLFFGRGTLIAAGDPSAGYSPRHHGLTIRATSIADARPALSAGPPSTAESIPGVAPFGLERDSWNTWRAANPSATSLSLSYTSGTITGPVTGAFTATVTEVVILGQAFAPSGSETPVGPLDRYVPVFATVAGSDRVVGFLHIANATTTAGTLQFDIRTGIAARNATTALAKALPTIGADAEVDTLFGMPGTIRDVLRAPVLVNRHLGSDP